MSPAGFGADQLVPNLVFVDHRKPPSRRIRTEVVYGSSRDGLPTILTEPHFLETQRGDEGADALFRVPLGGIQDTVLAGRGRDLLHRPKTRLLDEFVVRTEVQGAKVAIVEAGLLFVEAGGEDLGFRQIDGDGIIVNAHVVFVNVAEVDPRLDVAGGDHEYLLA